MNPLLEAIEEMKNMDENYIIPEESAVEKVFYSPYSQLPLCVPKLNLVRRFMEHFGQLTPNEVTMPGHVTRASRADMMSEETAEYYLAVDKVSALDSILDLLYVTYGAAVEAGFKQEAIDEAFLEVHRSNMSKLWTDKEKADHEHYCKLAGQHLGTEQQDLTFEPRFDKWIAKRNGKVIKSPSYSPAQLEKFCQ